MYCFNSDYTEGCHPAILEKLVATNMPKAGTSRAFLTDLDASSGDSTSGDSTSGDSTSGDST
ncbi:MAG: hypothetical protein IJN33_03930, partial [Phascolarctobacterium sp.]|nr:hypothetical protein [Phascolarctobacterium sp.]